jgi:hypothetical protein
LQIEEGEEGEEKKALPNVIDNDNQGYVGDLREPEDEQLADVPEEVFQDGGEETNDKGVELDGDVMPITNSGDTPPVLRGK